MKFQKCNFIFAVVTKLPMPVFSEDKNLAKKENSEGPTTDFKQSAKHPKILLICGLFFCLFSCGVESCFHRCPKNLKS